jgi:hypothetical protein
MRKKYKTPLVKQLILQHTFAASVFNANENDQHITPTDDEYNGKFRSPKQTLWDEQQ